MFGSFRLVLALAVVISHMGFPIFGIHSGIVGVVCFFMVSGYAMSGLILSKFHRLPEDVGGFYLDRIFRLAPQYYVYLTIAAFTVLVLGWRETIAQNGPADAINILANLLVIPMTFWMFIASIGNLLFIMPAWSLGLETCFYVVLPWILASRTTLYGSATLGAAVWALSSHGVINPDWWAYRLLPGTLVFFLVGVAVQRKDWRLYCGLLLFFAAMAVSLWLRGKINFGFNLHLLVGAAIGSITVPLLARFPRNEIDDRIGSASYGCFLVHWIFVTALKQHYGEPWAVLTAMAGSVACGWLTYTYVETPTVRFRRGLRSRKDRRVLATA